ncbi:MAG TPA: DMT family transporter [Anaerolineae bacterium]
MQTRTAGSRFKQQWQRYEATAGEITFLGVVAIWGVTFVFTRDALQVIGPFAYNTLRMTLGGATLAVLAGSQWRLVQRSYAGPVLVTGLVLFASYTAQAYGQQFTSASKAGFLTGTSVVYVPILSSLLLQRAPDRFALLGVVLAFAGLTLLSVEGSLRELALARGDLMIALSGVGWAVYIISLTYYAPRVQIMPFAALHVLVAAAGSGLFWLFTEPLAIPLRSVPLWIGVLTTGFLILGVGTSVQTWVTRLVSPTRVGLITTMEPVFAAVAGRWAGEALTARIILGGALILAGMLVSELIGQRRRSSS